NIKEKYRDMIIKAFHNISFDVASAFYIVTYLNNKTIDKNREFFQNHKYYRILIDLMIKEKRLAGGILAYNNYDPRYFRPMSFEDYKKLIMSKKDSSYSQIIYRKRIYSLPWLIKEIRDKLLNK